MSGASRAGRLARTPAGRVSAVLLRVVSSISLILLLGVLGVVGIAAATSAAPSDWREVALALFGTLVLVLPGSVLAAGLGIGSALWARWIAPPPLQGVARHVVQLLGEVPPLVWAIAVLALPLPTSGIWVQILITMGITAVATPAVASRALRVVDAVPQGDILQAMALGAPLGSAVAEVALPRCRRDLVRAAWLGLARALGDTLVVLLVCGLAGVVPVRSLHTLIVHRALDGGAWVGVVPAAALVLMVVGLMARSAGGEARHR